MALRFVLDENQRGSLRRAVVRHNLLGVYPVDVVRVGDPQDLPLGSTDPEILVRCEHEDRILVSFDHSTLAGHLEAHLQAGRHSPGIFMLRRSSRLSQVMTHLALAAHVSAAWEWADRIEYIPY
jgi:hypothetical protein